MIEQAGDARLNDIGKNVPKLPAPYNSSSLSSYFRPTGSAKGPLVAVRVERRASVVYPKYVE